MMGHLRLNYEERWLIHISNADMSLPGETILLIIQTCTELKQYGNIDNRDENSNDEERWHVVTHRDPTSRYINMRVMQDKHAKIDNRDENRIVEERLEQYCMRYITLCKK